VLFCDSIEGFAAGKGLGCACGVLARRHGVDKEGLRAVVVSSGVPGGEDGV